MPRKLDFLKSNPRIHLFLRTLKMRYRRWRYGARNVHPTAYIAANSHIWSDLIAHEHSFININCLLGPNVEIGRYAMLAPHVAIVGGDHRYDKPGVPIIFAGRTEVPKTTIGADAWIGQGAILIAGITVGRGAIVAAGAVVTKDVPPYEIHAGVPARKIGVRFARPEDMALHDQMLFGTIVSGSFCKPPDMRQKS